MIFAAATLCALGKTFFWPTMLGVVAVQCPKGGALTLNAIGGIGMLAVGTLGFPYIGALQAGKQIAAVASSEEIKKQIPDIKDDKGDLTVLEDRTIYEIIRYQAISDDKVKALIKELPEGEQEAATEDVAAVRGKANQGALANMAIFPLVMLIGYLALIVYFKSKGGYEAEVLTGHEAEDEKFTGGVEGPVE